MFKLKYVKTMKMPPALLVSLFSSLPWLNAHMRVLTYSVNKEKKNPQKITSLLNGST